MIPQELMDNASWCVWKREVRGGKPTKVPYNPKTGRRAETDNPDTFCAFQLAEEAFQIYGEYDGVGIRVSNGFSAIDIDHCIVDGALSDMAKDICEKIQSYTEKSPSGSGLRIIIKGEGISYDRNKYYLKNPNNGVEFYVSGMTNRFMTVTGNTLYPYPIRNMSADDLTEFLDLYMRKQKNNKPARLTDDQIISKASQNEKFCALFNGDMTSYSNDHSSADLGLCNILAFWTGKDEVQMDSIFRKSALYREKWEREDYRRETLRKAISNCTDIYDPMAARKIWDKLDVPYLDTGDWTVENTGIYREQTSKRETKQIYATSTPLAPAAFLESYDSGLHKVELHYLRNNIQRTIVCEREMVANKTKILALANHGINITSNDSAELVRYLSDMERLNQHTIPCYKSISRMGWVGNKFVPYDSSIKFDGEEENRALFQAVSKSGEYEEWVKFMMPLRKNLHLRLIMAASFASPLIERVDALPFVFHLWGKTGMGKTVALMVAMSIWGDPRGGKLTRTMNMTNAAMMSTAAFLNNLPFAGDELQTIKEMHSSYDKLIMQITEGIERGRMQYSKNLAVRSWNCAFLFTGEEPCTNSRSGGGTKNRVFEVNYTDAIIENGAEVVRFISKHHGHAGKKFINHVANKNISGDYDRLVEEIMDTCDTTDKQAAVAALILLADHLANECIFTEEDYLSVYDIAEFLKADCEVSTSKRAYDYIIGWIAKNNDKFCTSGMYKETWGAIQGQSAFVIDSVLNSALEAENFSFDAVKRDWADKGWLNKYRNKYKKKKGINGMSPYCVEIVLLDTENEE